MYTLSSFISNCTQMPTFSVPTGTATAHSSDLKSTNTTAATTVVAAVNTKKKPRENKNKNKKKTHIIEESVIADAAASADAVADADVVIVTHQDAYDDDESLETFEEAHEPTFPDIVILKQTDRNYIVKHNHYPFCSNENKTKDDMLNNAASATASATSATAAVMQTSDLVSPNQIYKGQINKKRGRKPKAGFILNSTSGIYDASEVPNIILHLKCHISDLKTNDSISNYDYTPSISEVESYNLSTNILQSSDICQSYQPEDDETPILDDVNPCQHAHVSHIHPSDPSPQSAALQTQVVPPATVKPAVTDSVIHVLNERHQKEIMKKINRLKYSFHNGETIQMKLNHKCACFWDTCEFDGPTYYLPIMIVNGVFHVSGCFCSPECALAALLKEQLDTSTKFERIHLLHLLYGSSSNKGFKPAPNPNYLLDKYYGNLTIDEYRSLLKGPQMIHIVNKPLTHILPELYEDNNDFLVNSKVIPTNNLKLKKRYKTMVVQGGAD